MKSKFIFNLISKKHFSCIIIFWKFEVTLLGIHCRTEINKAYDINNKLYKLKFVQHNTNRGVLPNINVCMSFHMIEHDWINVQHVYISFLCVSKYDDDGHKNCILYRTTATISLQNILHFNRSWWPQNYPLFMVLTFYTHILYTNYTFVVFTFMSFYIRTYQYNGIFYNT